MEAKSCTEIVKVIRTLLTSAKNGLLTTEIADDYFQMEGKEIPFRALGYDTLEALLRDTNLFVINDTKQGIRVMSKSSKDGNSIKSPPNSPNKGKKKGSVVPPQRALRSTTDSVEWNGTAYSQAYTQMPNRSVRKAFTHPAKSPQINHSNGGDGGGGGGGGCEFGSGVSTKTPNSGLYRPILKQSNIQHVPKDENLQYTTTDEATNWMSPQSSKSFQMRSQNHQRNLYHERINRKPNEAAALPAVKSSVQSRLAIQKTISIDPTETVQETHPSNGIQATPPNYANGKLANKV